MTNKTMIFLVMAAFVSGFWPGWASTARAQDTIEIISTVETEVKVFNEEGRRVTVRKPAEKVVPGSEVIYTTRYSNTGKEPAEKVVITNPVPEHLLYKEGSAAGDGTTITFSVDNGQNYNTPEALQVTGVNGRKRPAKAAEYTHIRWELNKPLPPGGEGLVVYRAILK